jgi:tetratricopeptide (TPR) repeat protein
VLVVLGGLLVMALAAGGGYLMGSRALAGIPVAVTDPPKAESVASTAWTEEGIEKLDAAITRLRTGEAAEAAAELEKLAELFPNAPSLLYARALAAIEAGDFVLGQQLAEESAKNGCRVSDSLALSAVAMSERATWGASQIMGDPALIRRELLAKAIAADPLNPGPRIELASFLRSQGYLEKAEHQYRIARSLLLPVDGPLAIDATLALIQAQRAEADTEFPPRTGPQDYFRDACLAAKAGDDASALALLEEARSRMPSDTYLYLRSDPALRSLPALSEIPSPPAD